MNYFEKYLIMLCFSLLTYLNKALSQELTFKRTSYSYDINIFSSAKQNYQPSDIPYSFNLFQGKSRFGINTSFLLHYSIFNSLSAGIGMGYAQKNYYYDYTSNIIPYSHFLQYNYFIIPTKLSYYFFLSNRLTLDCSVGMNKHVFISFKHKSSNPDVLAAIFTSSNNSNYYSFPISIGVNYSISERVKIPLALTVEYNNFDICNVVYGRLLTKKSYLIGIKSGFILK